MSDGQVYRKQDALENEAYFAALKDLLYQLADDDLVVGHRASEWLGIAPDIEEDVAFSSISQDEVGHANYYYGLLSELGEGSVDTLAYERPADMRRNAPMLELDRGDWADTIVRHYFYDVFEDVRLAALEKSTYLPLRQGAIKIRREEYYHLLHHELWFRRLFAAGGEARERMESAVARIWPYVAELFAFGTYEASWIGFAILPVCASELINDWEQRVRTVATSVDVQLPSFHSVEPNARDVHGSSLQMLLFTMSEVYNLDKNTAW